MDSQELSTTVSPLFPIEAWYALFSKWAPLPLALGSPLSVPPSVQTVAGCGPLGMARTIRGGSVSLGTSRTPAPSGTCLSVGGGGGSRGEGPRARTHPIQKHKIHWRMNHSAHGNVMLSA